MKREAGLTLVEVMVSLAILAVVLGGAVTIQGSAMDLMGRSQSASVLQDRARSAIEDIARELRWAQLGTLWITAQNGSARLSLRLPQDYVGGNPVWSTQIVYYVEPSSNDANGNGLRDEGSLVREQDGRRRIVCDHLVPGGFTAQQAGNNVTLGIQLVGRHKQRLLDARSATAIALRN